ncbi:MAG: aldo/keto reductase [Clostridiales bacterium]|nr:aldo/keto reductase [Clostridiales bacterium]
MRLRVARKRIQIPDTELSVYPIGLGTVNAGLDWDGETAGEIFDAYLSCGGNLIDTAHVYSDWVPGERARSERVVGDWLEQSGRRNEVIIMTKGGHPDMTGADVDMHASRTTRKDMTDDLNGSLKQLRTDYIDILFYHRDDRKLPVEEAIDTMEGFVKEGKIRYYGCSNWDADRMTAADDYCKIHNYRGFVADQSLLNIGMKYFKGLDDDTLRCTHGAAYTYHINNKNNLEMPYMGNCGGFFQKYVLEGESVVKSSPYYTEGNIRIAKRIPQLMEKYNCSVTQVVMGFFFHQDFACVPLFGSSRPEHIIDACKTLDVDFSDEDYEFLLS